MSTTIRVYLSPDGVEALRPLTETGGSGVYVNTGLEGSHILLRGIHASIPESLTGHVEKVTLWASFPIDSPRGRGMYQSEDGTAEGELEVSNDVGMDPWGNSEYVLDIQGKNLESVLALCADIKKGKAVPAEGYEDAWTGSDERARFERQALEFGALKMKLGWLTGQGYEGWWPFCRKSVVVNRLKLALAGVSVN